MNFTIYSTKNLNIIINWKWIAYKHVHKFLNNKYLIFLKVWREGNESRTILRLTPTPQDDMKTLTCRARSPSLPNVPPQVASITLEVRCEWRVNCLSCTLFEIFDIIDKFSAWIDHFLINIFFCVLNTVKFLIQSKAEYSQNPPENIHADLESHYPNIFIVLLPIKS